MRPSGIFPITSASPTGNAVQETSSAPARGEEPRRGRRGTAPLWGALRWDHCRWGLGGGIASRPAQVAALRVLAHRVRLHRRNAHSFDPDGTRSHLRAAPQVTSGVHDPGGDPRNEQLPGPCTLLSLRVLRDRRRDHGLRVHHPIPRPRVLVGNRPRNSGIHHGPGPPSGAAHPSNPQTVPHPLSLRLDHHRLTLQGRGPHPLDRQRPPGNIRHPRHEDPPRPHDRQTPLHSHLRLHRHLPHPARHSSRPLQHPPR